jgi:predicted DNA-binding protein YlxM (UPF0122 family)
VSDWIPIGEPEPAPLTPTQKCIKELLDQGKKVYEIVWAVHMGKDFVLEEIYQIRKWESIMGKGKLDNTQRAEIYQAWKDGTSQAELARQYGVSDVAIHQLIKKLSAADGKLKNAEPLKKTQINKEFDAAVDEMIAESKAMDLDTIEELHNAEIGHSADDLPAEKDTLDTKSDTSEPLPDAVYKALLAKLNDIQFDIEEREQRIAELTDEIRQLKHDRDEIIDWKDKYEH